MDQLVSKVRRAAHNPWIVLVSMITGIAGFVLTVAIGIWPTLLSGLKYAHFVFYSVVCVAVIFLGLFTVFLFQLWSDSRALRYSYSKIHEINHAYRDALAATIFHAQDSSAAADMILDHSNREVDTLSIVVQKIAHIFRELIGSPCMVTVKVCDKRDGKEFCFAIARSERKTSRDQNGEAKFSLDPHENNAFAEARQTRESGISHFYSPDLIALADSGKYFNKRESWRFLYKSAIVVPIRYNKQTTSTACREIGFLCVDTKARYRLNGTYHIELMAAFADQMYNFLNLSRSNMLNELLQSQSKLTPQVPNTSDP